MHSSEGSIQMLVKGILFGLLMLWCALASVAQSAAARGTISGTVTDPQGNAVAGAQVTVRNTDFTSARTVVNG